MIQRLAVSWFLYYMVAHFTMRTFGVNQVFRSVIGMLLHRKSHQILKRFRKRPILHHTCALCSELPSYISTVCSTCFVISMSRPPFTYTQQNMRISWSHHLYCKGRPARSSTLNHRGSLLDLYIQFSLT